MLTADLSHRVLTWMNSVIYFRIIPDFEFLLYFPQSFSKSSSLFPPLSTSVQCELCVDHL